MIRKKQTVSPPSKYVASLSPRNAPQEVIVSDTSIRAHEYMEEDVNDLINKQTAKFYTPQFRAEQNGNVQKSNNNRPVQGQANVNKQTQRAKSPRLSNAQQQALMQLQKAKKNKANIINDSSWKKEQLGSQFPPRGYPQQGEQRSQIQQVQKVWQENDLQYQREGGLQREQQYVFDNGDKYSGQWVGKYIEGSGVYDFTKQNLQYRGYFKRSKQHGKGTLLHKPIHASLREDVIYDGEWMNGYKQGFGKYFYAKDTYYEGQWIQNMKQGHGRFVSPEGEYVGQWKQNKKHGRGQLKMYNGQCILEGKWQNDKFVDGTVHYSNGDKYQGQFKNELRDGYGAYKYCNNQTQYKGQWNNGQKHGSGTINFYNGDKYNGGMVYNKKEGQIARYEWSNGDYARGQFVNDKPVKGKIFIKKQGRQYDFDLNRRQ